MMHSKTMEVEDTIEGENWLLDKDETNELEEEYVPSTLTMARKSQEVGPSFESSDEG